MPVQCAFTIQIVAIQDAIQDQCVILNKFGHLRQESDGFGHGVVT